MSELVSEALAPRHDRSQFRCGEPELDAYLQTKAAQDIRRKVAAVYVMVERRNPSLIIGYYTLSSFAVETALLPEDLQHRLPRYPLIPATLIGRLARDVRFPGLGSQLLVDALKRISRHAQQIGSAAVIVDVKNEAVKKFYLRHGFMAFGGTSKRLFLPVKAIPSF